LSFKERNKIMNVQQRQFFTNTVNQKSKNEVIGTTENIQAIKSQVSDLLTAWKKEVLNDEHLRASSDPISVTFTKSYNDIIELVKDKNEYLSIIIDEIKNGNLYLNRAASEIMGITDKVNTYRVQNMLGENQISVAIVRYYIRDFLSK
jgi:hypothetical protein